MIHGMMIGKRSPQRTLARHLCFFGTPARPPPGYCPRLPSHVPHYRLQPQSPFRLPVPSSPIICPLRSASGNSTDRAFEPAPAPPPHRARSSSNNFPRASPARGHWQLRLVTATISDPSYTPVMRRVGKEFGDFVRALHRAVLTRREASINSYLQTLRVQVPGTVQMRRENPRPLFSRFFHV